MDKVKKIKPIPNSPQEKFLKCGVREVGFGGQAGGAKSYSLILDAMHQLQRPGYNAILFRRTYKRLSEAGGLIDLSKQVYPLIGGKYNKTKYTWIFPNNHNNTIRFSHLEHESSVDGFSGSQYAYIGFDELQEFTERQYLFMFSRNRASAEYNLQYYIRSTFNPGGIGHYWIKKRFIDTDIKNKVKYFKRISENDTEVNENEKFAVGRTFIPSRLEDNPYLYMDGAGDYEAGLSQLDTVDFKRLRNGDWDIKREGLVYHQFNDDCVVSYDSINLSECTFYHAHDFGAVNRAWGLFARDKNGIYYLVHDDILGEGTTQSRANIIKSHFNNRKIIAGFGGAPSEKQQRLDYKLAGVDIRAPIITDVEGGISAVNSMFEEGKLKISSTAVLTIDQLQNCFRDKNGNIIDKSTWHNLDVLRYLAAGLKKTGKTKVIGLKQYLESKNG